MKKIIKCKYKNCKNKYYSAGYCLKHYTIEFYKNKPNISKMGIRF